MLYVAKNSEGIYCLVAGTPSGNQILTHDDLLLELIREATPLEEYLVSSTDAVFGYQDAPCQAITCRYQEKEIDIKDLYSGTNLVIKADITDWTPMNRDIYLQIKSKIEARELYSKHSGLFSMPNDHQLREAEEAYKRALANHTKMANAYFEALQNPILAIEKMTGNLDKAMTELYKYSTVVDVSREGLVVKILTDSYNVEQIVNGGDESMDMRSDLGVELPVRIGTFAFEINLATQSVRTVRTYNNQTRTRPHPHIESDRVCYGNMGSIAHKALMEYDIMTWFDIMDAIIRKVRVGDCLIDPYDFFRNL